MNLTLKPRRGDIINYAILIFTRYLGKNVAEQSAYKISLREPPAFAAGYKNGAPTALLYIKRGKTPILKLHYISDSSGIVCL